MIEGPSGAAPSRGPRPPVSFGAILTWWQQRLNVLRQRLQLFSRADHSDPFLWRLQLVNRVFWAVLAGLGCYLVMDLALLKPKPPILIFSPSPSAPVEPPGSSADPMAKYLKPVDEYRTVLTSRNPFQLEAAPTKGSRSAEEGSEPQSSLKQIISNLSVVGINRGRIPEALIEDVQSHRTYFVKVGDLINAMTVISIDERGVVVSYEGTEALLP